MCCIDRQAWLIIDALEGFYSSQLHGCVYTGSFSNYRLFRYHIYKCVKAMPVSDWTTICFSWGSVSRSTARCIESSTRKAALGRMSSTSSWRPSERRLRRWRTSSSGTVISVSPSPVVIVPQTRQLRILIFIGRNPMKVVSALYKYRCMIYSDVTEQNLGWITM